MKKISIVTLHFYDNYGSVLQAWALRSFVNSLPGCRAEIVPFRPQIPEYRYFSDSVLHARYLEKQAAFAAFRQTFLGLTTSDTGEEIFENLESDAWITGSDIVWSREHAGLHPAYFLSFARLESKRIAYAASMRLRSGEESILTRYLPVFDAISVRESADAPLVSCCAGVPVQTVLDPTLLLPMEAYAPLEKSLAELPKEPYLLFYSLTHDPAAVDAANLLAKRFGLRLVHSLPDYPAGVFPKDALCCAFCDPQEFLGYVKRASLVFTNSYHGTALSVLYRRPFYTQVTRGKMSARVLELTTALGLESRCYHGWTDLPHTTVQLDWAEPEQKLNLLRQKSQLFLQEALR